MDVNLYFGMGQSW